MNRINAIWPMIPSGPFAWDGNRHDVMLGLAPAAASWSDWSQWRNVGAFPT